MIGMLMWCLCWWIILVNLVFRYLGMYMLRMIRLGWKLFSLVIIDSGLVSVWVMILVLLRIILVCSVWVWELLMISIW